MILAVVLSALAPGATASPSSKSVKIVNYAFQPGKLTIKKGTKVTWKWPAGPVVHNVTVANGPVKFHSHDKSSGAFAHVFSRAGTYHLVCTLHPSMTETVVVT